MTIRIQLLIVCFASIILCALAATSHATVIGLRNAMLNESSIEALYTFEGTTLTQRGEDKTANTYNVSAVAISGGNVNNIAFPTGFDSTSDAFQPEYLSDGSVGAAFRRTTADLPLPSTGFTVEMLVAPNAHSGTQRYALALTSSPTRAYPLFQREGDLKLAAGNGSFADGGAMRDVVSTYQPGDWYYVAMTFENISGPNVRVNSYIANLSNGETTLTQTLTNQTPAGTYGSLTAIGLGAFTSGSEIFDGMIDEVAIYGSILPASTFQQHLNVLVPEPSSIAMLIGLAGVGLVGALRRRRRIR